MGVFWLHVSEKILFSQFISAEVSYNLFICPGSSLKCRRALSHEHKNSLCICGLEQQKSSKKFLDDAKQIIQQNEYCKRRAFVVYILNGSIK